MPVRVGVASGRELGGTRGGGLAVESEGTDGNTCGVVCAAAMFALLFTMLDDVNTINTWAEVCSTCRIACKPFQRANVHEREHLLVAGHACTYICPHAFLPRWCRAHPSPGGGQASECGVQNRKQIGTTHCVACKQPHSANGVTPNTVIDSNDEPAGNNQQRMVARGY